MQNRIKIRRRGKRRYYAIEIPLQYRDAGEPRTEVMASSREELAQKYEKEIAGRRQALDRNGGKKSLKEFLENDFLPFYKNEVETQTWCDYRIQIETHVVPFIGTLRVDELTTRHIDQWILSLRSVVSKRTQRTLSDRTVDYALAVLRRALQFAVDWRYVPMNPASARVRVAKRRRKVKVSPLRFLTPEQSKKLMEVVAGDRYEALYLLALVTGMREGELFGLKWSDLDFSRSRLTVNHSLAHTKRRKGEPGERFSLKGPKTMGSRRTIEIPDISVAALQRHVKRQEEEKHAAGDAWKEDDFVFTSKRGTPLDPGNALHRFQNLLKTHGLPKVRFYDLRHTHASLLIAEGVHAKKIAERLGHSSIKLTMDTYGHLFDGSDRESAERMDRLFAPPVVQPISDGRERTGGAKILLFRKPVLGVHADTNADTTKNPLAGISVSD
ncbi:MAG: site-specific integrase [Acidobacteriota bacterium]